MNSGLAYTIVKPGGLSDTDGGKGAIIVGHDDTLYTNHSAHGSGIPRADVATVITEACKLPTESANTRFDIVTDPKMPVTKDFHALFAEARNWE